MWLRCCLDLSWDLFPRIEYSDKENIVPHFFKAELRNGILDLEGCEVHS